MAELFQRLIASLFVKATEQFGFWATLYVALAIFLILIPIAYLAGFAKEAWSNRAQIKKGFVSKYGGSQVLKLMVWGFLGVVAFSFLFLPSNPLVAFALFAGMITRVVQMLPGIRVSVTASKVLVAGTALCLALTLGGFLHDVTFPPTAHCRDGTYSSSSHRRGTCSWHGGVSEWNPRPWWQAIFS